jgi:hypothetical protein
MRCLVTGGKHVNGVRTMASQPPITIQELLEVMFSVVSAPRLYSENPRPAEWSEVKWLVGEWDCSVWGWQLSTVQGRLRWDGAIVALTDEARSSVAGYLATWAREAEEAPLLESVARERLLKRQEFGKGLVDALVICELRRLGVAL